MSEESQAHRERLIHLLEHANKQVRSCGFGERFATISLAKADGYNAIYHRKEIERNRTRAELFRKEAAALEFAIDLIDRWEDAAADARFEDR